MSSIAETVDKIRTLAESYDDLANAVGADASGKTLQTKADEIKSTLRTGVATKAQGNEIITTLGGHTSKLTDFAQELDKIGTPSEGQPSTLFEAIAAGGSGGGGGATKEEVALFVQKFREAGINVSEDATLMELYSQLQNFLPLINNGLVFTQGTNYLLDALLSDNTNGKIEELHINDNYTLPYNDWSSSWIQGIKKLYAPYSYGTNRVSMRYMYQLRVADLRWTNLTSFDYVFQNASSLIDLRVGYLFNGNVKLSNATYSKYPSAEVLSDSSLTLVDAGETFANNREKWNWCLREHMAAYLPDRTGQTAYTITFGTNGLAAMEDETIAAFTAKNWTLA